MTVRIKNHNNFPITITLKTNNISKTFDNIKPQEQLTDMYDWTNISKTEGSFLVFIENEISHGKDSFQHGQYFNGELGNYMDLKFNGEQYKIVVTD